jgi:hypothetical protein
MVALGTSTVVSVGKVRVLAVGVVELPSLASDMAVSEGVGDGGHEPWQEGAWEP